jgi:hypothetical protein
MRLLKLKQDGNLRAFARYTKMFRESVRKLEAKKIDEKEILDRL